MSAFLVSVVFVILISITASSYLHFNIETPSTQIDIRISDSIVKLGRQGYYYEYDSPPSELGLVYFDLYADLRPAWDWNTKQLFVYLVASYETEDYTENKLVLWDGIIRKKEDALINKIHERAEYLLSNMQSNISGLNTTLRLHYEIDPHVGMLYSFSGGHIQHIVPQPRR